MPVETIFDMGVGDLFVCRNAGDFDTPEVNATFEYGVVPLSPFLDPSGMLGFFTAGE